MFNWIKEKIESRRNVKIILDGLKHSTLKMWFENGYHYIDIVYDKDSEYYKKYIAPIEKEHEGEIAQSKDAPVKDEIKDYMTSEYINKEKTNYDARRIF